MFPKLLVGVVFYNRHAITRAWVRAWNNAIKPPGCKLLVIHNFDDRDDLKCGYDIIRRLDSFDYISRHNEGMDIGAFKRALDYLKANDFDLIYWSTDDALPMREDFLDVFMAPFKEEHTGLVCNYYTPVNYYPGVAAHARTVSFAVRREPALRLVFPPKLDTKQDCYSFEYGDYNMTRQVTDHMWEPPEYDTRFAGDRCLDYACGDYSVVPACGDFSRPWYACNEYVWDCGELNKDIWWDWRRRQDHWARFEEQFK